MDPTLLIGDVVERHLSATKAVEFPALQTSSTGFPQHKRRWKSSAFKKQRSGAGSEPETGSDADASRSSAQGVTQQLGLDEAERRRIDQENRQKIASMSPQEIAQAQDDIMQGLNPTLVQRLLQRANIDDHIEPSPFDPPASEHKEKTPAPPEDKALTQIPPNLFPITNQPKSTHFPAPPSLPDIDPSDPNFLATLHEKYFPSLPADPSKLAWMAPVPSKDSPADKESPYYPHPEIGVSALRFDFRGRFLSPRISRSIPSTRGLHHHGEAPEAAGYTVAELARLARSAVPAQRCMAYQTLGRILYRLGHGEWGKTENDPIAMGVWDSMKQGRVLESLLEAAAGEGGHRGSRAYATEALWLFEKGGWKEKLKGR
ncbi:transcription factor Rba50 [Hirsutella rhossiliensis]|uniref:Transcription factor Rba50 n=1 Tax=Hirsutella rhossiliensis TaxID=111463 RepID=A0A9P8MME6_9HYPO|nr:transcription factor Rba50 [Hirsutella rhossiliensis]KAH0958013.1 transcription factor Rba50 [Hirsutella rhossiliensis]